MYQLNWDKPWTCFQIDAEIEFFGTSRIVKERNVLWAENKKLQNQIDVLEAEVKRLEERMGVYRT